MMMMMMMTTCDDYPGHGQLLAYLWIVSVFFFFFFFAFPLRNVFFNYIVCSYMNGPLLQCLQLQRCEIFHTFK